MANMAPQTAYQGSKGMKRIAGKKAKRTIAGKSKRPRVTQAPVPGSDLTS